MGDPLGSVDWSRVTTVTPDGPANDIKPALIGSIGEAAAHVDAGTLQRMLDTLSQTIVPSPPSSEDVDRIHLDPGAITFDPPASPSPSVESPPTTSNLSHLSPDVQTVLGGEQTFQRSCNGRSMVAMKAMTDPVYAKRVADDPAWAAQEEHRLVTQYGGGARPDHIEDVAGNRRDDPEALPQGRGLEPDQGVAMVSAETGRPHHLAQGDFTAPLVAELEAGRPVLVMSMGHAKVATGIHKGEDGKTYVAIYNPMNGTVTDVDLDDLKRQDLRAMDELAQKYPNVAQGGGLPIVMAILPGEATSPASGH